MLTEQCANLQDIRSVAPQLPGAAGPRVIRRNDSPTHQTGPDSLAALIHDDAELCQPESATSFDDLVGAGEERLRDGEAERLGGLQVDHQLEFGRLLDRQVAGLCAL